MDTAECEIGQPDSGERNESQRYIHRTVARTAMCAARVFSTRPFAHQISPIDLVNPIRACKRELFMR
ncbi:hypothetical protein ASF06_01780 [Agreia sp. Leaf244]|nr:hypothetical protein ASF06_01780 [Agreia sp. Leaf244]